MLNVVENGGALSTTKRGNVTSPAPSQRHEKSDSQVDPDDARFGTLRDIEVPPRLSFNLSRGTCTWENIVQFGWIGAVFCHPFESSSYYIFGRHDKSGQWIPDEQVELQYRRIMWDTHDRTRFLWVLSCIAGVGALFFAPLTVSVEGLHDVAIWNQWHFCAVFATAAGGAITLPILAYLISFHASRITNLLFPDHYSEVSREEAKLALRYLYTVHFAIAGTLFLVLTISWYMAHCKPAPALQLNTHIA